MHWFGNSVSNRTLECRLSAQCPRNSPSIIKECLNYVIWPELHRHYNYEVRKYSIHLIFCNYDCEPDTNPGPDPSHNPEPNHATCHEPGSIELCLPSLTWPYSFMIMSRTLLQEKTGWSAGYPSEDDAIPLQRRSFPAARTRDPDPPPRACPSPKH